jgi:hypothetical protein
VAEVLGTSLRNGRRFMKVAEVPKARNESTQRPEGYEKWPKSRGLRVPEEYDK